MPMNQTLAIRMTTLASTFLAALALPACKKDVAHGASAAAPASEGRAAPPAADSAQQAEGEKLHAAIECLNWLSANIFEIRDKYLEAKAVGFDAKALRKIVSLRKKSQTDRQEEEAILAVYMHALGMIDEAPEQPAREVMDAAE